MKVLRYIGYLLLGGLVGGIIGGILGNFDGLGIENLTFATRNNVVVISIVATMINHINRNHCFDESKTCIEV